MIPLKSEILVVTLLCVVSGCSESRESDAEASADRSDGSFQVAVTGAALHEMVQTICGDFGSVVQVVPAGNSSRSWSPDPATVQIMQRSDLILLNGAGYEPWRSRVSLPGSRVVDTADTYYDQFIRIPDAVTHQHGPEGSHSHPGTVWATWIDPRLANAQLDRALLAIVSRNRSREADCRRNAAELKNELEGLERRLSEIAAQSVNLDFRFVADGPYYQYLTRNFQQPLTYLHWTVAAGGRLSEAEQTEFDMAVAGEQPVVFLVSDGVSAERMDLIQNRCAAVVSIDLIDEISDTAPSFTRRLSANLDQLTGAMKQLAEAAPDSAGP